jgi:hypothetical protein
MMTHTPSLATVADYFRLGIEAGLIKAEVANAWAMSLVEAMPEPPYEIIELALNKGMATTIENLAHVHGDRDNVMAGQWLLGYLRDTFPLEDKHLRWAARQAMQIAQRAELGDDIYYRFDSIDDEISLASSGAYFTMEDCRNELLAVLNEFPSPPTFLSRI